MSHYPAYADGTFQKMSWRKYDQYKSVEVNVMNKIFKAGLGVGITSILALGIAIPVFNDVDVKTLSVSGIRAVSAFVADEGDVEKVSESSTDSTTETITEAAPEGITAATAEAAPESITAATTEASPEGITAATAEAAPEGITAATTEASSEEVTEEAQKETEAYHYEKHEYPNYIEFSYENVKGIEIPMFDETYSDADLDTLLEESKKFDINKYDEELQKIAQEYLAQGLYLSDLDFCAKVFGSGVGYCNIDDEKNIITEVIFTNGFDVVDENNGNNTFYISVLRMTPEEFVMYEKNSEIMTPRTETEDEVKYEVHDEYNNWTLTYNKKTGILIESNYFTEEAMNAVG